MSRAKGARTKVAFRETVGLSLHAGQAARSPRMVRIGPYLFLLPHLLFFGLFVVAPLIYGLWVSLHQSSILGGMSYVGLDNFIRTLQDRRFWQAVQNTLVFAAISVPLAVALPLGLALLLNRDFYGRLWALVAFVSPTFFASSGILLVWYWMLDANVGLVNYGFRRVGLIDAPVGWFTSADTAWMWIIIITLWWISGFSVLLFLSALQRIPPEQYEAAMLDGAGPWVRFRYITLPWIRNVMFFVLAYQVILAFGLFDQVYVLTGGGPVGRTRTIVYYLYLMGFQRQSVGRAAAISWYVFILVALFSLLQLWLLTRSVRSAEEE